MVKRVVGVEGDLVRLRGNARVFDGDGAGGGGGFSGAAGSVVEVPKGHVWVEGDEGFHSRDSNDYGPVRCQLSIWPPRRGICGVGTNPCGGRYQKAWSRRESSI